MRIAVIGKSTFKKESPLMPFLDHYSRALSAIHRVIGRTPTFPMTIKEIQNMTHVLPRGFERSQSVAQELRLIEELENMIDGHLKKRKDKTRPLELVMTLRRVNDMLIDRIKRSMGGGLGQNIQEDPSYLKLLYFIREMQGTQQQLEVWATKRPKRLAHSSKSRISYLFPEQKSTKAVTTQASTFHTRNQSKYQSRHTEDNPPRSVGRLSLMKRCSTANMATRPKTGTQWRCPSAVDLNKQQEKLHRMSSQANLKKRNRLFHNTIQEEEMPSRLASKQNTFRKTDNKKKTHLYTGGIENDIQGQKVIPKRRVSILNQASARSDGSLSVSRDKSVSKDPRKSRFSRNATQPKDCNNQQSSKSSLEQSYGPSGSMQDSLSVDFDRKSSPKKSMVRDSGISNLSQFAHRKSGSITSSSSSSIDLEFEERFMKLKKQRLFKRVRRSAKILKKQPGEIVEQPLPNRKIVTKPSQFAKQKRRAAHLNKKRSFKHKRSSMASVTSKPERPSHAISYTDQALVNPVDLTKRKKGEIGLDPVIMNEPTPQVLGKFGTLFGEMNNFLNDFRDGTQNKDKTVFFEQQEIVGARENKQMKERLQLLMEKQLGLPSHFLLACRVSRNQQALYDQLDRYMSFKAEQERLKGQVPDHQLLQKAI